MGAPEPAADTRSAREWEINMVLSRSDGLPISGPLAEELGDAIIDWAEERGLQVGGGMRTCPEEEET